MFRERHFMRGCLWACLMAGLSACIDERYDLDKDIDYTISVGGDLSVPASSTEDVTLKNLLDMEENSMVQADEDGFYSMVKTNAVQQTDVKIDSILFNDEMFDSQAEVSFLEFPEAMIQMLPDDEPVEAPIRNISTSASLEKTDITEELLAIDNAVTELPMDLEYRFLENNDIQRLILKEGYEIRFPEYITISASEETDAALFEVDSRSVRIKQDLEIGTDGLTIPIMIRMLDFTKMPEGSGFRYPSYMKIDFDIVSTGQVYFYKKDFPADRNRWNIHFARIPRLKTGKILNCKVKVAPDIDMEVEPIWFDNVPDFLSDEEVVVDLYDPKMYMTVTNTAPVDVNVNAEIFSHRKDGSVTSIEVGDRHGTPILIPKSVENYIICFHKQDSEITDADQSIQLPNIDILMGKMPEYISVENIESEVPDEYYYVRPGRTYSVTTEGRIEAPLAFCEETNLVYEKTMDGWHEDLDKYEIRAATVTMEAENRIPLDMELEAEPVDVDGNRIEGIAVAVDKDIKAGNQEQSTVMSLNIDLTSQEGAMRNLDGLVLRANATVPSDYRAQQLNENQTLALRDIRIKIKGGIKIDLN